MVHYTQDDTLFCNSTPCNLVEFYHTTGGTCYNLLPWRWQQIQEHFGKYVKGRGGGGCKIPEARTQRITMTTWSSQIFSAQLYSMVENAIKKNISVYLV
jgi:hypothetical protein